VAEACTGRIATSACLDASSGGHTYVLREGDRVVVPAIHQACTASGEGGTPDLFCERLRGSRHQVVIFDDTIQVWKVGNPDAPAWSGKP